MKSARTLITSSIACVGLVLGTSQAQDFTAHPSTQDPAVLVTLDTLAQWEQELSNWGR